MTELVNNTFQILVKVTNCKEALLMRVNNLEHSLIAVAGGESDKFRKLAESIFQLYRGSGVDKNSVENLPACKKVIKRKKK